MSHCIFRKREDVVGKRPQGVVGTAAPREHGPAGTLGTPRVPDAPRERGPARAPSPRQVMGPVAHSAAGAGGPRWGQPVLPPTRACAPADRFLLLVGVCKARLTVLGPNVLCFLNIQHERLRGCPTWGALA